MGISVLPLKMPLDSRCLESWWPMLLSTRTPYPGLLVRARHIATSLQLGLDDPSTWEWLDDFKYGNANYLWTKLIKEYERFNSFDKVRLLNQYFKLPQYVEGQDPAPLLQLFQNNVHQLALAGIVLQADIHWATWLQVVPPSMKTLQDQLGMDEKGTYFQVYKALKGHYDRSAPSTVPKISKNKRKINGESQEQLNVGVEQQDKTRKRFKGHRSQPKRKDDINQKPNLHCDYCSMNNHVTAKCFQLKRDRETGTKLIGSDLSGLQGLSFIEIVSNAKEGVPLESTSDFSQECANTIFLFDSGATTHLTGNKQLLTDIAEVPEVQVGTALKGATAVIRQRGKVVLNDHQYLRDVAYVSNATNNLISEGRLCDADIHHVIRPCRAGCCSGGFRLGSMNEEFNTYETRSRGETGEERLEEREKLTEGRNWGRAKNPTGG